MSSHAPITPAGAGRKPVTLRTLAQMKKDGQRITMLTGYDATFARLLDAAGVDMILVGDSLGMVVKGEANTLNVSVEQMAYHTAAVARGVARAHVVGDMPFMSYQTSPEEALKNAARLLQSGASSVKLEGGRQLAPTVARLVEAGIPVMGHVGLMPQSVHAMGGFVVQGKDPESRQRVLDDAVALEAAGAYAVVLEGIPIDLATEITETLAIPTIGIGAGAGCDGQVLVLYDLLGLNPDFTPKFVKKYVDGAAVVGDAVRAYVDEVKRGVFPDDDHAFHAPRPKAAATATKESLTLVHGRVVGHH
ncbi:MAG: 3-methyl-2-oxobutanoate hydroxymethyltransferase [Deltaproteobacteria bacterium]|nr:3-methyl-2-oxobutanoate hydroxymethyltransferase [Deltaproteobacteria bacterium]